MSKRRMMERTFTGTRNTEVSEREKENRRLARRAAEEGIVLLKNEGRLLPVARGSRIALYGTGASRTIKGGTGSGDVNERESVSIWQGMRAAGYQIMNEDWLRAYDQTYEAARLQWRDHILAQTRQASTLEFFQIYTHTPFRMPVGGPIEKADCDLAIYVISRVAGEGADRKCMPGDYELSDEEKHMLARISSLYAHVIVVGNTGGLIDLSFLDDHKNIDAFLYLMQPGMEGGNAFAQVLSGEATPSGKLTDTWAYRYEDYPNSAVFSGNNGDTDTELYEEGIYVGYRYFDTFQIPVRYGFGCGLSYTEFQMRLAELSYQQDAEEPAIQLTIEVKNIGSSYSGKEVVQVYASAPFGKLEKEHRRLAAFAKTKELEPNESEQVQLTITLRQLASYEEAVPGWVLEPGYYGLWLGNSLGASKFEASLLIQEKIIVERNRSACGLKQGLTELHMPSDRAQKRYEEWKAIAMHSGRPIVAITESKFLTSTSTSISEEAIQLAEALTTDQLIQMVTGDPGKRQGGCLGASGISVPGSAGETSSCAIEQNIASIVLADGPAGLRLLQSYLVEDGRIGSMPFQAGLEGGLFCPDSADQPGNRYYQYCTAIPVGNLLAQTWNLTLLKEVGAMIGGEMQEFGITLWLAPGMNLHRNPLCGRNFEYYSEDPFLTGRMAAAMTQGVQSEAGCGTTIKHLACNNQEDNRKHSNSVVSERALREIYLKGFEIAVKEAEPMAIMTSYNQLNGIHAANNRELCTQIVREEWGFGGLIMTDWTTTEGGCDCTASGCIRAGNDLIMPGTERDHQNIRDALASDTNPLPLSELKECAARIIAVILRSNQYEHTAE